MKLDNEVKRQLRESTRDYLNSMGIEYDTIAIRDGEPIVIVSDAVFHRIVDGAINNVYGKFLMKEERGWSAYVKTPSMKRCQFREMMTEYQATRFVLGLEYGRKERITRYTGGISQ